MDHDQNFKNLILDPRRFSVHRLAHYCLDLSEMFNTDREDERIVYSLRYPEEDKLMKYSLAEVGRFQKTRSDPSSAAKYRRLWTIRSLRDLASTIFRKRVEPGLGPAGL
ncbi:MAG: hypothetical protein U5L00_17775 [Desulfovermiculus sp.]|nr:hypothetical protein [Desulfovermiculus sp.]